MSLNDNEIFFGTVNPNRNDMNTLSPCIVQTDRQDKAPRYRVNHGVFYHIVFVLRVMNISKQTSFSPLPIQIVNPVRAPGVEGFPWELS